jgi:uncharacterized protein HemX
MDEKEMMATQNEEYQEEEQNNGGIAGKVLFLLGAACGIGGTVLWQKNKPKREARKQAKAKKLLEKNGYVVQGPETESGSETD